MTNEAIEILLYFLSKTHVQPAQQDQFFWAVTQLESLRSKQSQAA